MNIGFAAGGSSGIYQASSTIRERRRRSVRLGDD
jgi:hypothetical protein